MSVTTKAIDNIREMIADGRLKPGDRLPLSTRSPTSSGCREARSGRE